MRWAESGYGIVVAVLWSTCIITIIAIIAITGITAIIANTEAPVYQTDAVRASLHRSSGGLRLRLRLGLGAGDRQ